jgi:uncharacterized protein (DUF488 family)
MKPTSETSPLVLTIGHSTRALEAFNRLLHEYEVNKIVDVRTVPRSTRNPQFNRETLPKSLTAIGIGYVHVPGLGGLRHPRLDSMNQGWLNSSLRGFADYMQIQGFEENLQELVRLAGRERVSLMCAEALPWRCHRSLISDALLVRGIRVEHILGPTHLVPHILTPWAHVDGTRLIYPPAKPKV